MFVFMVPHYFGYLYIASTHRLFSQLMEPGVSSARLVMVKGSTSFVALIATHSQQSQHKRYQAEAAPTDLLTATISEDRAKGGTADTGAWVLAPEAGLNDGNIYADAWAI